LILTEIRLIPQINQKKELYKMALRNVVKKGEPILKKISRPVENFDEKLGALLDDLSETNINCDGAGLAAPQVGILRRVAIVSWDEDFIELINPEIVESSGSVRDIEGCLSCPNEWGYVTRPDEITFDTYDRNGEKHRYTYKGYTARAVLHEMDHLDGILFTDIADEMVDPKEMEEKNRERNKKKRGGRRR
jgi:peptide deformylase